MYAIYHAEIEFFERYKISPNPWPWKEDKKAWTDLMKKTVALVTFNNLVCLPFSLLVETLFHQGKCPYAFDVEGLPSSLTLMCTIAFCMFVEDASFTAAHWTLHRKALYPYIHKLHHTHVTPVGIAAEYAHPIEFMLGNLLPVSLGPALLGKNIHLFTVIVWYTFRALETLDGHSGYEFSWSPYRLIPFSGSASYHDFHHTHNVGNYSSFFSLWDTVFGLNVDYHNYQEEMKQMRMTLKGSAGQEEKEADFKQALIKELLKEQKKRPIRD